jgi:hypothetical protein
MTFVKSIFLMEYNPGISETELVEMLADYTAAYTHALNNNLVHAPLKEKIDAIVAELNRRKNNTVLGDLTQFRVGLPQPDPVTD